MKKSPKKSLDQRRLEAVERSKRVLELRKQGMSNRAIARKLNCDDKTVSRDIEKSELPEQHQLAIANGAPVEPLFRQAEEELKANILKRRIESALAKRPQRLAENIKGGRHSKATADAVCAWLANHLLLPEEKEEILRSVERALWTDGVDDVPTWPHEPADCLPDLGPAPWSPKDGQVCTTINYCAAVLYRAIRKLAPEQAIRDAAFAEAIRIVANRPPHSGRYNFAPSRRF